MPCLRSPTQSERRRTPIKTSNTTQSTQSKTTAKKAQAPKPAPSTTANSTAGQAPAPQANQAPNAAASTTPVTSVANGSNSGTKSALQTSYVGLIAGLQANYQPDDVFVLVTGNKTTSELVAGFQQFVQAAESTKASYQAYRADVQAERQIEAQVDPDRAAVRSVLEARYGKSGTQLLQYGFAPQKIPQRTALSKAAAAVKVAATRDARGTKGSKEKLKVKGNVTGVILTPVTSTQSDATPVAAPAAVPAPAAKPAS